MRKRKSNIDYNRHCPYCCRHYNKEIGHVCTTICKDCNLKMSDHTITRVDLSGNHKAECPIKVKKTMKIKGKVFWLYPCTIDPKTGDVKATSHWTWNKMMWLFNILSHFEGFAADVIGVKHFFVIKIDKKDREKLKKINANY